MIALMVCDDCNTQMKEVFHAQDDFRLKGWMCPSCFHFAPAIGREKGWTIEDKTKTENDRRVG